MNATRKGITAFVAAIAVSLLIRSHSFSALPASDIVVYGGLLLGAGLWIVGCYYGYLSVRTQTDT